MKRLSRDKYTTVLDPTLPAAITIASGEEPPSCGYHVKSPAPARMTI